MTKLPGALAAALLAVACTTPQAPETGATAVTIMTFNVENLFDTKDDPGKDDRTFLPAAAKDNDEHRAACNEIEVARWRAQCLDWDWNEQVLEKKLAVVAAAIRQVNGGRGPDILALQEVENVGILERLRKEHLGELGYAPSVLLEGRDDRGIDVAFLTRVPLARPPVLHEIPFDRADPSRVADTRGILEATFRLPDGSLLTGFAVHFPAPFHPTDMRIAAYERLNELAAALPSGRPAFAAGDFNTTSAEDLREKMLDRHARPHWTIVHEYCGGCRGTSYYAPDDSWSFLDMILWAPGDGGAQTTWRMDPDSVRIANGTAAQVRNDGTPWRFEMPAATGVSDHWPLVVTIESHKKQRL